MAVDIVAIMTPALGKEDAVEQTLNDLAKAVKAKEPQALRYQPYKSVGDDGTIEYV